MRGSSPATRPPRPWPDAATGIRRRGTDRRTSPPGRRPTAARAAARRRASLERRLDDAHALELDAHAVAARERKLPRERPRHDVIAGLQPAPVGGQLAGQPGDRAERVAEHGVAPAAAHLGAVDADAYADRGQVEIVREPHGRAEHEELLLRVVGQGQRTREIAARLDDLQRRMRAVHRASDLGDGELGAGEIAAEPDADLVLEAGRDEVGVAKDVTARDAAFAQQAAEYRLVDLELLLDGLRGQAHLEADVADPARAASRHQRELDAVRVVEVEPILPRRGEVDAPRPRR